MSSREAIRHRGEEIAAKVRADRQARCEHNFVSGRNRLEIMRDGHQKEIQWQPFHKCSRCDITYRDEEWKIYQAGFSAGQRAVKQR
jgi:hypothetical protein